MDVSMTKHFKNNKMIPVDLDLVATIIQQEGYSEVIEKIRLLRANGDDVSNEAADKLKEGLPFFMPSLLTKNKAWDKVSKGSKPTGLIQFDIDLKHNPDLDMEVEKAKLATLPYMKLATRSPSGGLKFFINSNLRAKEGESWESLKDRFKQAYHVAKRELKKHVDAVYDDVTQSIQQGCFVSSDADIYYNPNATEFDVGELVYHEVFDHSENQDNSTGSYGPSLETLLPFIDKDLGYMERLPIICGALSVYGQECIPDLVNHFNVENTKLRRQIEKIYKHDRFGSYGTVVNAAVRGGYQFPAPRKLTGQVPQVSAHIFPQQLTREEGREFVKAEIEKFFSTGESLYLSIPCGLGKSTEALMQVALLIEKHKFVFFAKDHKLAEQHTQDFKKILCNIYGFEKGEALGRRVKHIYGATNPDKNGKPICKKTGLRNSLSEFEASLSVNDCFKCPHISTCQYVNQFEKTDLVRFMVTDNLFLPTPKWWHGMEIVNGEKSIKTEGFEPDFIIVDEDSIKKESWTFSSSQRLKGLSAVLDDLDALSGDITKADISQSIRRHEKAILKDYNMAHELRQKMIAKTRAGQPIKEKVIRKDHHHILQAARDFLVSNGDPTFLHGVTYRKASSESGFDIASALIMHEIKKVHPFFEGKPMLFLDATANSDVVSAVYPNISFKKITVKFPEHIKVLQLTSATASKSHLSKPKNVDRIISFLKSKIDEFRTDDSIVGVITYQNVSGTENFWEDVSQKLGASEAGYFGGMRGSNALEDVDIEVIIGRQKLDHQSLDAYSHAIFDKPYVYDESVCARPIRMQDGSVKSLDSRYPSGVVEQAIYDHFCIAETIQMIGRARPYWGKPKIIFYCSNEALGGDVEITDFISFGDDKYSEIVVEAKKLGVVNLRKPAERAAVGISSHDWRENRGEVIDAFASDGGQKVVISGVDGSRNQFSHEYIVFDHEKLKAMTANTNFTVEEVDRFPKLFG